VLEVLDAIQQHLAERAEDNLISSLNVALNGRRYTLHDRGSAAAQDWPLPPAP
jgi:hypothetical protein